VPRVIGAGCATRLGAKSPVISDDGYITMGGPDEATYYVTECGPAWHRTPGAVARLADKAYRHLGAETADTCGRALIT
jgi:hypothetical protein